MIRALILLTLAACAHSHSEEQHAEVAQETHAALDATQSVQQETHSEEGEWTRRTWEFVGPQQEGPLAGGPPRSNGRGQAANQPASSATIASATGESHPSFLGWPADGDAPLLRYTEETHAPAHVDTSTLAGATQQAKQESSLKAASEAHSASKTSYWPPVTYLIVGLLAAAAVLWLARGKLKLALGVLGKLF